MNENNKNLSNFEIFEQELSDICGERIGLNHIHEGSGREYYIQATEKNKPMLLRHYRGPLFVDLHKDDLLGLQSGAIDANEFIHSANWQVGYYWGGGSMMEGGYYQPVDIMNHRDDLQRYLRILSCRTNKRSSGHIPSAENCAKCTVENCPFSPYDCKYGNWKDEPIQEFDPRVPFFKELTKKFEQLYPGYTIRGWLCNFRDDVIPDKQAWVRANSRWMEEDPYSFMIFVDAKIVRGLLMHEINGEDAEQFIKQCTFHHAEYNETGHPQVTIEHIKEIFSAEGMDYPKEELEAKKRAQQEQEKIEELEVEDSDEGMDHSDEIEVKECAGEKQVMFEELEFEKRPKRGIFKFIYNLLHR